MRTFLLTTLALLAFAANSLLARQALATGAIDATSFTAVRLAGGAFVLALLVRAAAGTWAPLRRRGVGGPLALFLYALPFSLSYVRIGAATGALLLFGSVQLTMLAVALRRGERPRPLAWCGFALAAIGLVWLLGPAPTRPDLLGALLMVVAGVAWGAYTLAGRAAGEPIAANARSFLWSLPLAGIACWFARDSLATSSQGLLLAGISGGVTSGLGYAVWYRTLPRLTLARAAFAQLTVPVLAALGAVSCLGEAITPHLVITSVLVLGGVAVALASRARTSR